ncbi:paraneoplastic antigen-like protein 8B [Trichechus manatus latirostris]|uniref:Paraneoplastic antigen-like protein 8B n=1 Tax=Trichechus manatus latirostris TaxID=127582 RepID=A0A2Y9DWA2_TRIMA|nr:paraneoplastic antigen-like protein 8B [Trichechus manatus latirostris]
MALSLLEDWCRGLGVDVRRALLVTGIPEGLEQAAVEAVLQPAFLAVGAFRLRSTRRVRKEKAKAALVEFVEDVDHAAIPREIPGQNGVWRVLCKDRAEDPRVLRQMKRLLLDERPARAQVTKAPGDTPTPPAPETLAQGLEQAARKAGPPPSAARKARRGRRGRGSRARGNRGKKRGRGGRPSTLVRSESEDSSDESLGIVIEEIEEDEDEDQRALYATLQAAAKELVKKWAVQNGAEEGDGPREFLALVTVTDKAKKEETEKEPPSAESTNLDIKEDRNGVPDLVALLAVRETSDEEPVDSDTSESESQDTEDQETEEADNPEFVAIVAYTDPSDPSAREEMLKIASVVESLGWSDKKDKKEALSEVLSVMSKDTSGTRVKVEEAGREVDAMVLRKAEDNGNLLECISTLAEPETPSKGKKAPRGFLSGWGGDDEDEGGLLELVALLAAQDMAEVMKEGKGSAWECEKYRYAKGNLGEVLALLAAREIVESEEESDEESASEQEEEDEESEGSEDTESEESGPEERASRKPRAKRARTAARSLGQTGASASATPTPTPAGARKPRAGRRAGGRGRGRVSTPEKKAGDGAGSKKKQANPASGPHAKAGEAKGQPPTGAGSARGKKARRGRRLPRKCR